VDPLVVTQLLNIAFGIATLAVLALGLAIVFGLLGVLNIAHGELIMLGAYSAWVVQSAGLPFVAAIPLALVACALLGWALEAGLIRPLYARPFDTLLATWGLSLLLRKSAEAVWGLGYKSLAMPVSGSVDVLGASYPAYRLLLILVCAAGVALLAVWFLRSGTGTRIKAMVANPELAQAVGIRTGALARNTFIAGCALAGLGGVMVAPLTPVHPFMGVDYILETFFVLVVGGLGSLAGLLAGAGIVGGIGSLVSAIIDRTAGYTTVLVIAILFLWLRPRGLLARP
jgi:branched-chain amino acid transport system permease protein/urea transport system permease protein